MKFQSCSDFLSVGHARGISCMMFSISPASISNILRLLSSDKRRAITDPAVPPPTRVNRKASD